MGAEQPETIAAIVAAHRAGTLTPAQTVARTYRRIREHDDPAIFISLCDEKDAIAEAEKLAARADTADLPLYGVPVAVKDNIDALGFATTAACPAFSTTPARDSTAVARLRAAGAIIIGKTNLDQFATGLVGVRSPYGIPRNSVRDDLIPGGSSSGSAVAVGAGLVPLSLGTDTAGSGRVPAMLNNIVGLKPSLGMISNAGLVPACRTLDCISVFALTVDDAALALSVMAGPDQADPFSRDRPLQPLTPLPANLRLGVPRNGQLIFFGDKASEAAYADALKRWTALGATLVEFDLEPFYETARLLYEGPWVAERYLVIKDLLASAPDTIHPVTREITAAGARLTAAETFSALYRLQGLRKIAERTFADIDALVLPTAPTAYTTAQVLANPIEAQQPARHLHQFRQPARSLRSRAAGVDAHRRHSVRHHAAGACRTRCDAREHRPRVPCGHQAEPRRKGRGTATASAAAGRQRRRHPDRRGRRASLRHGAERRIEGAGREADRGDEDCAGLQALCAENHAAEARLAARRGRRGRLDRAGDLVAVAIRLRQVRQCDSGPDGDRDAATRGWTERKGIPRRAGGAERCAGYHRVWGMAEVYGGECEDVGCVSRAQRITQWCAAEPGPVERLARWIDGSRLCGAALRAAPRPGHDCAYTDTA